ncbi:nucleotide disphospho-sugar-binding domain-containing protein [Nitrosococcus wardiae]|uniref:Glycosyltransferase n=1 Tax=Nitrosococcus wardiae TaxID=1814290 RepID=A0A4P7BY18_9GAMM|nr:glycosyltransferase [Nitrosococcus wardiae]QBQ55088.1 glycosyltransferase [Nitrosococcus wardiae]
MRIGIQTWGSEGDIRPFLILGGALSKVGHTVTVVVTDLDDRDYSSYEERLGIQVRHVMTPVISSPTELERIGELILRENHPARQGKLIIEQLFLPTVPELYNAALELCSGSDLVIGHFMHYPLRIAAEVYSIPEFSVTLAHNLIPSRYIVPTGVPDLGRWANPAWWWLVKKLLNQMFLAEVNGLRQQAGLPLAKDLVTAWQSSRLNLVAVSSSIFPRQPDWTTEHQVCGFLGFSQARDRDKDSIPRVVEDFLAEGAPPLFMTFGSLTPKSDQAWPQTLELFVDTVRRAGCRAIIQGWPDSGVNVLLNDRILLCPPPLPHYLIFPHCAAVVHHGGAGTTHSTLAAGVPSIVVPHVADQFFWGKELKRLGVAPQPLLRKKLTAARLARRIQATMDSLAMGDRAAQLGQLLRYENGPVDSVRLIQGAMEGLVPQENLTLN